jgi:hypothetical protein
MSLLSRNEVMSSPTVGTSQITETSSRMRWIGSLPSIALTRSDRLRGSA